MVREEEEIEGREEKEEEEEKEETAGRGGGVAEKKRKGAHINTYATQTKPTKDRARSRYDLAACRYEHTNLSERSLRRGNGVLLLYPSMKYIGVYPHIRDAEE